MTHPYKLEVEEMLLKFGDLYSYDDILEAISTGRMQSFALMDSWAVTQVCEFPKRRVLDIVFVVGDLPTLELLESDVIGFAREQGIDLLTANGRKGFIQEAFDGWKMVSATFIKDLRDGT